MLQAALAAGTADRRSVFELFPRRLPEGRRYGVVAGVGRALDAIEAFRFDDAALETLRSGAVVDEPTLSWLADYRFSGDVWGYAEGEVYFPYSPLLVVESTFAEAVLLETVLLSIYNHDSAIASAASRMTLVAGGRPCIEMGSRRTHEEAAVAAARAAYVAGFASSSNLAARQRYGIPTAGTSAHSFTLLHDTEADAFRAQVDSLGRGTTLLVDTYDIAEAVRLGVEVAGPELGAVRIDSGDLGVLAQQVRDQLDALGATGTRIVVTSDLDEHAIAALASAPVDGYGVGTQLVTGSGHPTCGFVYKLVAREGEDGAMVSVAKRSPTRSRSAAGSSRCGGATPAGVAEAEVVGDRRVRPSTTPPDGRRPRPAGAARTRRRGRRSRTARGRPRTPPLVPRRAADRRPDDEPRRAGDRDPARVVGSAHGTAHRRPVLGVPRGRDVDQRRPAPVHPPADRGRVGHGPGARLARPLPAARTLRRPHGVGALHQRRALRRGRRPRGRDAGRGPQLLRRRGARPRLLDVDLRGAAPSGRRDLPRLRAARGHLRRRPLHGRLRRPQARPHPSGPVRRRREPLRGGRRPQPCRPA